jgi:hypothetical protein
MKKVIWAVLGLILIVAAAGFYRFNYTDGGDIIPGKNAPDPANMTFVIEGTKFPLVNGKIILPAEPDSATTNTLMLADQGNAPGYSPTYADLDGDGDWDGAAVLFNDPGGSGTFYYGVLLINDKGTSRASEPLLLGDRIDMKKIVLDGNVASFHYLDRKTGAGMVPTEPMIKRLRLDAATGKVVAAE